MAAIKKAAAKAVRSIGDAWGTADELAHPRGPDGRWIKKGGMSGATLDRVNTSLRTFKPREFQSDAQAGQYAFNLAHAKGRPFTPGDLARLTSDFGPANEDLVDGIPDEPSTKKFTTMMDSHMVELDDDIIVSQVGPPEMFGFTAQSMHGDIAGGDPGIRGLAGKKVVDRGYSATAMGTPTSSGTGQVNVSIAVPKGTKVAIPASSRSDRRVYFSQDQPLRVTKVSPDGRGGYNVMALAEPHGADPGTPGQPARGPVGIGRVGDREARVQALEQGQAKRMGGEADAPSDAPTPVGDGGAPQPAQGVNGGPAAGVPDANAPTPQQALPDGTAPRTEPVVAQSIGGAPTPDAAPGQAPAAPAGPTPPPAPDADVAKIRGRAQARERMARVATAMPVAQVSSEVSELEGKGATNKVFAQHVRATANGPLMDEVPRDKREAMARDLEDIAQAFDENKPTLARSKLVRLNTEHGVVPGPDKPGRVVPFDESTMDPVGDIPEDGKVEVIRPASHVDLPGGERVMLERAQVTGAISPKKKAAPRAKKMSDEELGRRSTEMLQRLEGKEKPAGPVETPEPTMEDQRDLLKGNSVPTLRRIGEDLNVDVAGLKSKEDLVDAIAPAALADWKRRRRDRIATGAPAAPAKAAVPAAGEITDKTTVAELKAIAADRGIDVRGLRLKKDIRDRVEGKSTPAPAKAAKKAAAPKAPASEQDAKLLELFNGKKPTVAELKEYARDNRIDPDKSRPLRQDWINAILNNMGARSRMRGPGAEPPRAKVTPAKKAAPAEKPNIFEDAAVSTLMDRMEEKGILGEALKDTSPEDRKLMDEARARHKARMEGLKAKKAAPKESPKDVADRVNAAASREEAEKILEGRPMAELKEIGDAMGMPSRGSHTRAGLINDIIDIDLGARLQKEAYRRLEGERVVPKFRTTVLTPEERAARLRNAPTPTPRKEAAPVARAARPAAAPGSPQDIANRVADADTYGEGQEILKGLSKAELEDVAKAMDLPPRGGRTKAQLIKDIIGVELGGRLQKENYRRLEGDVSFDRPTVPAAPDVVPPGPDPTPAPGTAAGKITALRLEPGTRILLAGDEPTTKKTGARAVTVQSIDRNINSRLMIRVRDDNGEESIVINAGPRNLTGVPSHQTFLLESSRAPAKKAAPAASSRPTAADFGRMQSVAEAEAAVKNLTKADLQAILDEWSPDSRVYNKSDTKAKLQKQIVQSLVQRRLDSDVIQNFRRDTPDPLYQPNVDAANIKPKAGIPKAPSASTPAPAARRPVRGASFNLTDGSGRIVPIKRANEDEPIHYPNNGQDQGLIHLDSEIGKLWSDLYQDDRPPNSLINEIARTGESMGLLRPTMTMRQVVDKLKEIMGRQGDPDIRERMATAIERIDPPDMGVPDLPRDTPPAVRRLIEAISEVPTAHATGRVGPNSRKQSFLDEQVQLVRDIDAGKVNRIEGERRLQDGARSSLHESFDGAFELWNIEADSLPRTITVTEVGPNGKEVEKKVPNPEWPAIRDWLGGVKAPKASAIDAESKELAPLREHAARAEAVKANSKKKTALVRALSGSTGGNRLLVKEDGEMIVHKNHSEAFDEAEHLADAEVLGGRVLEAVGIRAPASVKTNKREVDMEWLDGEELFNFPDELINSDQGRLLGLGDALNLNTDRGAGNLMRTKDGDRKPPGEWELQAIDNGFSYFFDGADGAHTSPFARHFTKQEVNGRVFWAPTNDMHPDDMALVRLRLEALKAEFERLGRGEWWRAMMDRFEILSAAAQGTKRRLS